MSYVFDCGDLIAKVQEFVDEYNEMKERVDSLEEDKCELEGDLADKEDECDELKDKLEVYEGDDYNRLKEKMIESEKYLSDANLLREMFEEFENKIGRSHF